MGRIKVAEFTLWESRIKVGEKMPLADESIVQISGVEKSNVIDDDGEFLLAI